MSEVNVPVIHNIVILDQDGGRMLAKYYDGRSKADQAKNELALFKKSKNIHTKMDAEIIPFEGEVVVFRSGADCKFFMAGPAEENELILVSVLEAVFESLNTLLKGCMDKRTLYDNLELVLLTLDEVVDQGHIVELDANAVVGRVLMRGGSGEGGMGDGGRSDSGRASSGGGGGQQVPVADMTISQALGLARDQFMKSLISSTN